LTLRYYHLGLFFFFFLAKFVELWLRGGNGSSNFWPDEMLGCGWGGLWSLSELTDRQRREVACFGGLSANQNLCMKAGKIIDHLDPLQNNKSGVSFQNLLQPLV